MSDKCPECKSSNLIHDYNSGEIVCKNCGLVLPDPMIDEGPEWRAYTEEEDSERSRVGGPEYYSVHDKGLSTTLEPIDRDAFGKALSPSALSQMKRLSKYQTRSRVYFSIERNLTFAMTELDRLADKLEIPNSVKEKAALIYRKALSKNLIHGRPIVAMAAASLCLACKDSGISISLQKIAKASPVDKKVIAKCYRLLREKLNFKVEVANPIKCVSKIANELGFSGKVQNRAIEILYQAKKKNIWSGRGREGLAAAALYIALLENEKDEDQYNFYSRYRRRLAKGTQKDIADAAGVTEVTLRNRYKELVEVLKIPLKI